jgi:hypothetical protein
VTVFSSVPRPEYAFNGGYLIPLLNTLQWCMRLAHNHAYLGVHQDLIVNFSWLTPFATVEFSRRLKTSPLDSSLDACLTSPRKGLESRNTFSCLRDTFSLSETIRSCQGTMTYLQKKSWVVSAVGVDIADMIRNYLQHRQIRQIN